LSPGTADVYARLGLIYFQQGRFEKAAPALRQALKLKPALPKIDVLLAMSLSELGRYEEALPALQKGFKQTADPVLKRSSGLHLQRVYTDLRQDDKAVEVALELTRAYPKDPEVLYHAGRLFGNYAYLSTVKLAEVAPDSLWLHLAAGEANESQGRFDSALAEYREVLSLDPKRPNIHYRIGRVLLARGSKSNRSAFGARVKVAAGGLVQTAERRGGGSYLSQNDTRLRFGLEKSTKIDYVEVHWPGGAVEKLVNIPANTFIQIKEGEGSWRTVIRSESRIR
jgi:tetratricopeptide (TPR) repeat protein